MNYHNRSEVSNSNLTHLLMGYPFYISNKQNPTITSKAMSLGTLYHDCILEGKQKFSSDYAFISTNLSTAKSPRATKVYKEWRDDQLAAGITLLDHEEYMALMKARVLFHDKKIYRVKNSEVEKEIFFEHMGVKCRSKLDFIDHDNLIIRDLKTIDSVDDKSILKAIWDRHYYRQAVFYKLAAKAEFIDDYTFIFDFISKKSPILHREVVITTTDLLNRAHDEIHKGIEIYKAESLELEKLEI